MNREHHLPVFGQSDLSTTKRYGGTGLGLTISAELAHCMGGRLWAESQVGRGSTFHLTTVFGLGLPRPRVERTEQRAALEDLPVLIVDDNHTNRRILERTASNWGMRPYAVPSAAEALAAMDRSASAGAPFRLVLSDMHMPEMDGFEATTVIRDREQQSKDSARTPIIAMTANAMKGDREKCLAAGMDGYESKPVKRKTMFAEIERVLGTP